MMKESIGVAYLVRGKDIGWEESCRRFVASYLAHPAGCEHRLYVVTKGFTNAEDEARLRAMLVSVAHTQITVADDSFDIGAYRDWAVAVDEELVCLFNTASEILGDLWLLKLLVNFRLPGVGIVGATGSFESLGQPYTGFPPFPNPHVRTNACLLRREVYLAATAGKRFATKEETYHFESGPKGLTRHIEQAGLVPLVVGRNGRGYSERMWPVSDTFRQGRQRNVLVGDRNTRGYAACTWPEKNFLATRAWGSGLDGRYLYRWA